MKKHLIALALLAAGCGVASAQSEIVYNPNNQPYFGVRASLDVTCPSDVKVGNYGLSLDMLNNGVGFSVGAIYNVPVYYNLYFEPGVNIYRHNAKYNLNGLNSFDDSYDKVTLGEWGFEIPLMFGYHFDFSDLRLSVFTGPEFRIGLSGKTHYTTYINNVKMKGSESMYGDDGAYNRADVSWRLGVGLTYDRYYFAVSGGLGLTNWLNDVESFDGDTTGGAKLSMHRNTVSVSIGYNF
jgi:hypothetical protein